MYRYLKKRRKAKGSKEKKDAELANISKGSADELHKSSMEKIPKIQDITVLEKISEGISDSKATKLSGNFGDVFKGKWGDTVVALKRLKSEDITQFEREANTLL